MLAALVVDMLISCTVLMLAGWMYDVVENGASTSHRLARCTTGTAIGVRKRDGSRASRFPHTATRDPGVLRVFPNP
jgi:hypothetical protein